MKWRSQSVGFSNGEGMLYGELLVPGGEGPFPGAVLCHGMASDHRAMRHVARRLTREGIATLTFDFRGHGRSEGVLDDNMWQDVIAALKFLRGHTEVNPKRLAVVGHSFGAWAAIIAAERFRDLRALVSISSPGETETQPNAESASLYEKLTQSGRAVFEYPRCGALPGYGRLTGLASTLWMWIRGYRARVHWRKALLVGQKMTSLALERMGDFPKLFVHCGQDNVTPYQKALELYQRSEPPKEFLLTKGGFHSTPLFPGSVREKWVAWLVSALNEAGDGS